MSTATTPTPEALLTQITDGEAALLKPVLLAFAQTMQQPNANLLGVLDSGKNVLLQAQQLSLPAQGVILKIVGAYLTAWINSIPSAAA